jgi:hypothetical protein
MGEDFRSCTLVLLRCRLVGIVLFLQCIYGMFVGVHEHLEVSHLPEIPF